MAVLLGIASTAAAEVNFSATLGLRQEDNIGFGATGADEIDDLTTGISAAADWLITQTATDEFAITAGAYYDDVSDISDLSRSGVTAGIRYRHQMNADVTAFWWSVASDYRLMRYDDSDIRDGYEVAAVATFGKRLTQRFGVRAGYRYETRESTDSSPDMQMMTWRPASVFDLDRRGVFAGVDYDLAPSTTVSASYTYMSGDVAATGRFPNPGSAFDWAWDNAFGPGFRVWRIDADQNIFEASLDHRFSDRFGVELTVAYLDASAELNQDYENLVFGLAGSVRF